MGDPVTTIAAFLSGAAAGVTAAWAVVARAERQARRRWAERARRDLW